MSYKVLVCVPRRPDLNPDLVALNDKVLAGVCSGPEDTELVVDTRETGYRVPDNAAMSSKRSYEVLNDRCRSVMPKLRQGIIDDNLTDHDYVMWADSDIVEVSNGLLSKLISMSLKYSGAITAPAVMCEWDKNRFYDLAGFLEKGHWANMRPPYFKQQGPQVFLDSVGCVYLVPGDVYRGGAKHEFVIDGSTDHFSVCLFASEKQGRRVVCDLQLTALHPDLNKYEGEAWH